MAASLKTIRRVAAKFGGTIEPDGCGGYEVLAPDHYRWIDGEVQCLVLALSEYDRPGEKEAEIQRCIDIISGGIERFPGE